jgi:thiol-disulfide isomerase/thioredoxin
MKFSIRALALCTLVVYGLSAAACKGQEATQTATTIATHAAKLERETPPANAAEAPAIVGYPTPEGLGRLVPTQDTSRVEATTAATSTPEPTPMPTASVYPAPIMVPTLATTGGYPPPVLVYPTPYPAPATPVEYANAYPDPGTPAATPTPGSPPILTPTPATVQGTPTSSAPGPVATGAPTSAPGSLATTPPLDPTQTVLQPTPTPTLYIVRTGLYPSDPLTVVLASGRPQLVEFYAVWSTESKSMAPVINGLEVRYHNRMNFIYLDVDDRATNAFKQALGYLYPPQFFLLDSQGKIINQWSGYVKVEVLETALQALVGQ